MKAEKVSAKRFIEILNEKELLKVVGGYGEDDDDRGCVMVICDGGPILFRARCDKTFCYDDYAICLPC